MANSKLNLTLAATLAGMALAGGCGGAGPEKACQGLVYDDAGVSRAQYLPCARQMVAALDRAEKDLAEYAGGRHEARARAAAEVRLLKNLIALAGGRKMYAESWGDSSLNELNRAIFTASYQYEAALLVPGNRSDFENGRRNHDAARNLLRSIR